MTNANQILIGTINTTLVSIFSYVPRFVSGLILIVIGIIVATILKQVVLELLKVVRLENLLKKYGVPEGETTWSSLLAELLRWFVVILFLVPAADVWGLGRFVEVLARLIAFLPNVFISVLLLLVGFVIANLVHDLLLASVHGLSRESAKTVATVGRWAVLVFVFLVVLSQLGIAVDLIRILFTGFVAMLAIAGGLAFGLGGQGTAKDILEKFKKRL